MQMNVSGLSSEKISPVSMIRSFNTPVAEPSIFQNQAVCNLNLTTGENTCSECERIIM